MDNITDSILKSIDIIIAKRLKDSNFDRTITAVISQNHLKEQGEYEAIFEGGVITVYALDGCSQYYEINQRVLVLVPENDFTKKKLILSTAEHFNNNRSIVTVKNKGE